jgi:hypothetical protein
MMKARWVALVGAMVLGCSLLTPAHAGVVTFDDMSPDFYVGDTNFRSRDFHFTATSGLTPPGGLVGVIDTADAFAFGNAPTNAMDQFYAALNDGGLTMTAGRRSLTLKGFEFGFITPLPFVYPEGYAPGLLVAFYVTDSGDEGYQTFEFSPADVDGLFAFSSIGSGDLGALRGQGLRSVTFLSCIYDGDDCFLDAFNQSQFAIDNISAGPEPGSLGLLVLSLGMMAGAARRRTLR